MEGKYLKMAENILTPVGRIVMGDCFEAQTKDAEGNPLITKTGPNTGKPRVAYFIALAVAKTDPGVQEILNKMAQVAQQCFPQLFVNNNPPPQFAWKYTDGDSTLPNKRGIRPCDKEGFPGHWVFNFTSGFAPKCYSKNGESIITDPQQIKRGYYVRIYGSIAGNESTQQPGLYLNHQMIELCGYGEEIITGPSGEAVFGGQPSAALPAGASTTPMAPMANMPHPGNMPAPGGQGGMQPPGMQQPPAPAYDFLQPGAMVTVNGQQYTVGQLRGAGWTDEQIKSVLQT